METFFEKAAPVFAEGLAREINITCGFYGKVFWNGQKAEIRIAASSFYQLYLNGEFVQFGPCRCGHGCYRVDVRDITGELRPGENTVALTVVGYNVNSFYSLDQPAFLQCEVSLAGETVLFTAGPEAAGGFAVLALPDRIRKMQRFSFQRAICESYRFAPGVHDWMLGHCEGFESLPIQRMPDVRLTARGIPLNHFDRVEPVQVCARGTFRNQLPETRWQDRSLTDISPFLKGFPEAELECRLSDELGALRTVTLQPCGEAWNGDCALSGGQFAILAFEAEKTGFLTFRVHCVKDGVLYFMLDELLHGDDVNPIAKDWVNAVKFELKKGVYTFTSMECYGGKYLKIAAASGRFRLQELGLREYVSPVPVIYQYSGANPIRARIVRAAMESYRQNAADIFTDCPIRERAGWLCDSFFTARTEKLLTGQNLTETVFLQNFQLSSGFEHLPEGMIPCCYPADFYDGLFIPNWALWFVLELADYLRRGGDRELVAALKDRVYGVFRYFRPYENEFGLLEKLDGWIFVEWSKANELVRDVNYPTNMLYQAALRTAGALYGDDALTEKAEKLKAVILRRSFDGAYFEDRELRRDGRLVLTGECTETCQYYAFFFGVATAETHPGLWKSLVSEFGPHRKQTGRHPEIAFSNAFMGNYMRLQLLSDAGLLNQLAAETEAYFDEMAQKTGTLWENDTDYASCNHGFASYAAVLIDRLETAGTP